MTALEIFTHIYYLLVAWFWLDVYKTLKGTIHRNLYKNKKGRS